ncbi:MAG: 3-deoxy-manno-octulosonate cytidylyltransferase [Acetivibrionales bacterium]|jgi:3-deoxy-manno-octulosonate cytidylyltransferase (CMP-KDO synthetase)
MKTLAVIPAKYYSSRLPGKPLMDVCGKTVIRRVFESAKKARLIDELIVATDDERILSEVESFGGKAMMTSPSHQTGTDRVAEVAAQFECSYVACIQCDEPLIMPEIIDEVITTLIMDKSQVMVTCCHLITDEERINNHNVVKVVSDINNNALVYTRSPIPYPRHREYYSVYESIGVFAFTKEFLLKYVTLPKTPLSLTEEIEELKALENGYPVKLVKTRFPYTPPSVDTPEDLEKVRELVKKFGLV